MVNHYTAEWVGMPTHYTLLLPFCVKQDQQKDEDHFAGAQSRDLKPAARSARNTV